MNGTRFEWFPRVHAAMPQTATYIQHQHNHFMLSFHEDRGQVRTWCTEMEVCEICEVPSPLLYTLSPPCATAASANHCPD